MEIALFIFISIGIILIPGPNVLVITSTSLVHGKIRGLQTVAGTSAAMLIQLVVAAAGTSWFVSALAEGFILLKWLGVIYLFYLGVASFIAAHTSRTENISASGSFYRGFWVSLTNPKTIIFFSAFLPQFVVSENHYYLHIAYLSLAFWLLAIVLDSCYVLLASTLSSFIKNHSNTKMRNYLSGVLYLGAGSVLAVTKNG